jgi:Reverse transcriptase (RNA-dependent DNA polymerase)
VKTNADGIPTRFKARLVAGGHRQVEGIDYEETYAPVSRLATIRTMLSVAAHREWKVWQYDVTTAFLHGDIDADVYMMQAPGFVDGAGKVYKLQKCLYGLKQAPRAWYAKLSSVLEKCGFVPIMADSSFWVRKRDDTIVYMCTVVDDILVTGGDSEVSREILRQIEAVLPGKFSGEVEHFYGLKVTWFREKRAVVLTVPGHINKVCETFKDVANLEHARSLPMEGGLRLCKGGTNKHPKSPLLDTVKYHYRALIGAINFISCAARPDVTYTSNQCNRYANAPTQAHWDVAIGCLRYLKSTLHWGIALGHDGYVNHHQSFFKHQPYASRDLVAYADANHGTGIDDKKSITGTIMHVYGGPVSWCSKVQTVASLSSTESEYRALGEACREALWLAKIVNLFNIKTVPFLIRGDSMGAIGAIKNASVTKHARHIEIVYEFMKDRVKFGHLDFEHIEGKHNPADILTKALGQKSFEDCRRALGMVCLEEHSSMCV